MSTIWLDGSIGYGDFVGYCDGVFFSMKMNNTNELERNVDFANRLYAFNAKEDRKRLREEDKRYTNVFQVNINNFIIKEVSKTININITTDSEVRRAKIIYVDIYLPRIFKKYKKSGIESLQYAERFVLAMFIAKESEVKKLAKKEEEIMGFIKKLKELKRDREAMFLHQRR